MLLASYRYVGLKTSADNASLLESVTLVVGEKRQKQVDAGVERGVIVARSAALARELANTPPTYLNADDIAERAVAIAAENGLEVEVFNKDQLEQLGAVACSA